MQPVRRDLVIPQGTSWTQAWRFTRDGQPFIDATWTAKAQVRATKDSDQVHHEWSTAAGTVTINAQGDLTLSVVPAISGGWTWRRGVYDVEVTKGATTHRLLEGKVTVDQQVTRP